MTAANEETPRLSNTARTRYWVAAGALVVTSAIYAAAFIIMKGAVQDIPPLTFVTMRFAVASIALLPLLVAATRRNEGNVPTSKRRGLVSGILFGAGMIFELVALSVSDAGRAAFIISMYIVFAPLLALLLYRYPVTIRIIVAVPVAVFGMFLLSSTPGGTLMGDLFALGSAFAFAGHVLAVERFPHRSDWRVMTFMQCLTVTVGAGILALLTENAFAGITASGWAAILFAGIVATALTLAIQVVAQRFVPPSQTAMLFALGAPFAAFFGFVFRDEVLTVVGLIGCGLIFIASVISTTEPHRST
jgi:drug/metabolite transporter (DMT)-like permease